jgi:hypothetical protein
MGELSWDDLGDKKEEWHWTMHHTVGAVLICVAIVAAAVLVLPIRDLLSSPAELAEKYPRSPAWLNRCDPGCARRINVSFIENLRSCEGLAKHFNDESRSDLLAWRLAIDDRASSLGCPGFPRTFSSIREGVQIDTSVRLEEEETVRHEREQQALDFAAQEIQRYEQSLQQGGLSQYVDRVIQDPVDRDTLYLTVNNTWHAQPREDRLQLAEVLWQKWAVIHSLLVPTQSSVLLVDSEGALLGEVPGDGETVWLAE